ncbi:cbb3-type cytochrome c oxidase subunit 3 [Salinarimonas sp. NSM]|uniref:cbb3-type cytochrome c oxidase subunit 3 n=1 Tax=Salinarimonas TaxID=690086 RepID=UPI0004059219|nr:cbb3-type cytochrome c oxidase subunit 3 [Salinarimonas rosea]
METYSLLASFAQTGGLLIFIFGFLLVIAYALMPSNRSTFDKAARTPIEED